jgi:hypothetical protein
MISTAQYAHTGKVHELNPAVLHFDGHLNMPLH